MSKSSGALRRTSSSRTFRCESVRRREANGPAVFIDSAETSIDQTAILIMVHSPHSKRAYSFRVANSPALRLCRLTCRGTRRNCIRRACWPLCRHFPANIISTALSTPSTLSYGAKHLAKPAPRWPRMATTTPIQPRRSLCLADPLRPNRRQRRACERGCSRTVHYRAANIGCGMGVFGSAEA
jgi:hypothetical protein